MPRELIYRFEEGAARYAIDPETCFCFECDAISWDVLAFYPLTPTNRILAELGGKYSITELNEVIGELEWLRGAKSILRTPKSEDLQKLLEVRRGLKLLTVALPPKAAETLVPKRGLFSRQETQAAPASQDLMRRAVTLLLSRSESEKELRLEFLDRGHLQDADAAADGCACALRAAKLAGKDLTAAVHVADVALAKPPAALDGHHVELVLEFQGAADVSRHVRALASGKPNTLAAWAKTMQPDAPGVAGRVVLTPGHPAFGAAVEALDSAGFRVIELDLDGAYVAHPELDPRAMLEGCRQATVYYAEQLLKHRYFRLDPIAPLFWHIYQGTPRPRTDPAGAHELAVDANGDIYPSRRLVGLDAFRVGSLTDGTLDEERLKPFDNVGAMTTPACIPCWARNLCGGGTAAVHYARTGSIHRPHEPWCDAQRAWMATAVSAFSRLSSQGVPFTRVYNVLGHTEKPSLFAMARVAFRMQIGVRPIEEGDAELLTRWENWNPAACFVFNETGLLLATKYDREMDSLHPRGIDKELVLVREDGQPFGLLKVRPDRLPDTALGWVYMHDETDYVSDAVRRSFRFILKEAGDQQDIRRLLTPAAHDETALQEFLEAVGYARLGVLREALYLHGTYHDVVMYGIGMDDL